MCLQRVRGCDREPPRHRTVLFRLILQWDIQILNWPYVTLRIGRCKYLRGHQSEVTRHSHVRSISKLVCLVYLSIDPYFFI